MEYLDGWELVPGHDDGGQEKLYSSKHGDADSQSESEEVLCPSSSPVSPRLVDTEILTEKKEENHTPTIIIGEAMDSEDPDPVSPISLKQTEFVDMKILESESKSKAFDDDDDDDDDEEEEDQVTKDDSEESNGGCGGGGGEEGGFDIRKWNWGLTGIGALCSLATVFVLVLGAATSAGSGGVHAKNNMGLKGYEENQRLKEMVSAVRGGSVPLTRAHITFGGYYDAPSLNH